nr:hypothetical protein KitaXyl93_78890 [Kitasatospora sp. Xyl93]
MQQVLADPKGANQLTRRRPPGLSPLFWTHVNPYGRFELDMNGRLDPGPAAAIPPTDGVNPSRQPPDDVGYRLNQQTTEGQSVSVAASTAKAPTARCQDGQTDVPGHLFEPRRVGAETVPDAVPHTCFDLAGGGAFRASG